MPALFFYLFSLLAVAGAVALICFRNPVSSAMSMVASFVGMAALFIGLNAYFVGIIQILVYAGAIMVLFLFIIMLLDLKVEEKIKFRRGSTLSAILISASFTFLLFGVLQNSPDSKFMPLDLNEGAKQFEEGSRIHTELTDPKSPSLPDVHLIGNQLFTGYNFPLQVVGVLLLVAAVGVVALSRKADKTAPKS
jgi:NADH-quinone oxidoreductase subunit J